jgi:uncharacterized protein (DUF58 family)
MVASLLSHDFLRRLDRLRLASNEPARGHLKGLHRANRTGPGMEFADYRPYSPGDDLKSVDWRTYLRLGRLFVKLFVEEADLPIYIFLDTSASMGVGSPSKFDFGRKIAAALAHIGFVNMDRVSLIAVAEGIVQERSHLRGKNQSWPAFEFLQRLECGGNTSFEAAFKRYFAVPRAKGLIVVISDFLDPAGFEPGLRVLRNLRQDVLALQLISPSDFEPAGADSEVVLVDSEGNGESRHRITPALLKAYRQAFDAHCAAISAYCDRNGWGHVRAMTDAQIEALVLHALRKEGLLR